MDHGDHEHRKKDEACEDRNKDEACEDRKKDEACEDRDGVRRAFVDAYHKRCTLQVSPDGKYVHLGTDVVDFRVGFPWWEFMPLSAIADFLGLQGEAVSAPTHMRLDAAQVAELIPYLKGFVRTGRLMLPEATARGFGYMKFVDADGAEFSLQESSAGSQPHIWLGRHPL